VAELLDDHPDAAPKTRRRQEANAPKASGNPIFDHVMVGSLGARLLEPH
jgi:hypothetical protein